MFPSERSSKGHIIERSGKSSFWHRITIRAGLRSEDRQHTVIIHDLRRTIATWNVVRVGSLQAASKLLGHSDLSITASTYAHLQLDQVRQELAQLSIDIVEGDAPKSTVRQVSQNFKQLGREEKVALMAELGRQLCES